MKHDIVFLGYLNDGLGFYRFSYNGSGKSYVGVMAQEVAQVAPEAVMRGRDGYPKTGYRSDSFAQDLMSLASSPSRSALLNFRLFISRPGRACGANHPSGLH